MSLKKTTELELMDTVTLSLEEMKSTLNFLELTNRYFGGIQVILSYLESCSQNWNPNDTVSILDVGTGCADIPIAIQKWAQKKNLKINILGIDLVSEVVEIAKEKTKEIPQIQIMKTDFFELLRSNRKFDYCISSLLLHHIPPQQLKLFLTAMDQISNKGFIASDLLRSHLSLIAVGTLSFFLGNRVVRHDGPLSVRRAFELLELKSIAAELGLDYVIVKSEPWFRISLSGQKSS